MKKTIILQKHTPYSIVFVPILIFALVIFAFDFNGLYGQDSHAYLKCAKEIRGYIINGTGVNEFFWPKAYPFLGAIISLTGVSVKWSLLFISLTSLIGSLIYTNKIIRLLYNKDASLFILLAGVSEVYFIRSGILIMSDALSLFLLTLVFYHYLKMTKNSFSSSYAWMLIFAILTFYTRYATIVLLIAPIFHGTYFTLSFFNKKVRILIYSALIISLLIAVKFNNNMLTNGLHVLKGWRFRNIYSRSLYSPDGVVTHFVPNALYIWGNFLHIGLLSFGVFLLPFYSKLKSYFNIFSISLLFYFVLLIGHEVQNYRFLVLSHTLVIIFIFPAFSSFSDWLQQKKIKTSFIICVLLFNSIFFVYSFQKTYQVHKLEKDIVTELKRINSNAPIYSFYVDQSFPSYGITNEVRNLYLKRYAVFEKGSLVIFNELAFSERWKETTVMKNWRFLKKKYHLDTISKLPQNWTIYRIK